MNAPRAFRLLLSLAALALVAIVPAEAHAAGECGYQLDPVWEVLRPLRQDLITDDYHDAFAPEVQRIDGFFRELDAWINEANGINGQYCEPLYQRFNAGKARMGSFNARCHGEIADPALYQSCVDEQAALQQEQKAVDAMAAQLNAVTAPLNVRGMDLITRAKAAADEIGRLKHDSAAALTHFVRFVQAQGGTADSCRSLGEIITTATRHDGGNSSRLIDDLAVALTGSGGSGFSASGFRSEYRISNDPAFRTVTWLALGYRGGATGDDALNKAAATLGRELKQSGNAASLGAQVRATLCQ